MLPLTPKSGWRYRAQQVLSALRFLYHWGFIPGLLYLGVSKIVTCVYSFQIIVCLTLSHYFSFIYF